MKTVKRAVIGTIAAVATLAAIFFAVVGVVSLVTNTPYMSILNDIWAALPFGK